MGGCGWVGYCLISILVRSVGEKITRDEKEEEEIQASIEEEERERKRRKETKR